MWAFVTQDPNLLFAVSICIVLILGVLEGVLTLIGFGMSQVLDSILPDTDFDIDLDYNVDVAEAGFTSAMLAWLRIGKVPLIISLIIFLTAFGVIGLLLQGILVSVIGILANKWLMAIPALILAMPVLSAGNRGIARVMPKIETSAVSPDSFIGRVAVVVTGTASVGSPAQAKLKDRYRKTHYVMVEPDAGLEDFQQGDKVLITERIGSGFRAIPSSGVLSK